MPRRRADGPAFWDGAGPPRRGAAGQPQGPAAPATRTTGPFPPPHFLGRAARLAESKGSQTRAILKVLGRGALLLAAGAFNLTLWVFGALVALFGFLSSIKATTERLTQSWLDRKKARRLRQQLAAGVSA